MLKYLNNLNKSLDDTRSTIFTHYIKWCDDRQLYDANHSPAETRVIFYSDKFKSDFKNPITKECNGVVFAYHPEQKMKWRILSYPPECFNMNPLSIQKMNKYYLSNAYQIYESIDGTMLTLYYYNGEWRFSSYKGYDVTFLPFCNDKTYMEVFLDITKEKYPSFSLDRLEKHKSYTVCVRYQPYHIFDERIGVHLPIEENSYIVFIQSVDLSKERQQAFDIRPQYDEDIGLPIQKPIQYTEKSITNLFNYAKQSYGKYERDIRMNGYLTKHPLYGFILRSKNAEHEYRNIYIESSLMKYIRLALYNQKKNAKTNDHSLPLLQLHTLLHRSNYPKYYMIFRQFSNEYDILLTLIKDIIPEVLCKHISSTEYIDIDDLYQEYQRYFPDLERFKTLISTIVHDMNHDKLILKKENENCKSIIYDYIHTMKYSQALYTMLHG